jgi:hypothetical protein
MITFSISHVTATSVTASPVWQPQMPQTVSILSFTRAAREFAGNTSGEGAYRVHPAHYLQRKSQGHSCGAERVLHLRQWHRCVQMPAPHQLNSNSSAHRQSHFAHPAVLPDTVPAV